MEKTGARRGSHAGTGQIGAFDPWDAWPPAVGESALSHTVTVALHDVFDAVMAAPLPGRLKALAAAETELRLAADGSTGRRPYTG
jgi:hypothetical protein